MEGTAPESSRLERVLAGHLLRVGALATLLSASANALVLAGASSLFGPVIIPPDEAVTIGQVMGASTAGAVGAAVVFAAIGRFTRHTIVVFWSIAAVGLLLSFIPIAWRAPRDLLRRRWPLCTWWPRSPTSVCSQGWAGRGRVCWGD
jgi:hypothetical protein